VSFKIALGSRSHRATSLLDLAGRGPIGVDNVP